MAELNITGLERAWAHYQRKILTGYGQLNLAAWMGERMGPVLEEVRTLRERVKELENTRFPTA